MLLQKVTALNALGWELPFFLDNSDLGYFIKDIDGLGPVKAAIASSPFGRMDGEQFHAARKEKRNIVMTLGLDINHDTQSAFDIRDEMYSFFMPKSEVLLTFDIYSHKTDVTIQRSIVGVVESCEPDIFAKDPTVVVSVLCFEPEFINPANTVFNGATTSSTTATQEVVYNGRIPAGVVLSHTFTAASTLAHFRIRKDGTTDNRDIDITYSFNTGDILTISTVPGDKYIRRNRSGAVISLLYAASIPNDWPILVPGNNRFRLRVSAVGGAGADVALAYKEKFGGL